MLKVSPHKCLPSILLLARDSNEQQEDSGSSSSNSQGRRSPNTVGNSIAAKILRQFVNDDAQFESMLSSYENVAEAYIVLAEWLPVDAAKRANLRAKRKL